jgi:hypothetical protein
VNSSLPTTKHSVPGDCVVVAAKIDAVPEMCICYVVVANRIVVGSEGAIGHDRYPVLGVGYGIAGDRHVAGIEDENP